MKLHRRPKDYHKKTFANPFFPKSKSGFPYYNGRHSKFRLLRRKLVLFLLAAVLIGWTYFLFCSPYFKIEKIEISGLEKISKEEIKTIIDLQTRSRRFLIFKQNNIFLFNEEAALEKINSRYALESASIDKKLRNTIRIEVKEKISSLVWATGDKFYNVDLAGIIIREIPQEEIQFMLQDEEQNEKRPPIIYDESNQWINIKDAVLQTEFIQFIITLEGDLPEKVGIEAKSFKMPDRQSQEIKVKTQEGWYIYFSSTEDLAVQIEKLDLVLKEKIKDGRKNLEYIDLRFGDRVYYK